MSEIERIAALLEEAFSGDPYYGPAVMATLEGVTAAMAVRKPCHSIHSIHEIVAHLHAELVYAREVCEATAGPWSPTSTWPVGGDCSEREWRALVASLQQAHRELVHVVREQNDAILEETPVRVRGPFYVMLHGTIQHLVLHAGELALLRTQVRSE